MRRSIDEDLMSDVLGWDVGTWSAAARFWERVVEPMGGPLDVLEVGAGPGGPSLWLALQGHRVVTSNLDHTESQARPLHERHGVADRVEYRDLDVANLPYENHFDLIVFKSVLGGVGSDGGAAQRQAVAQILKALKPGGRLLFAENIRGTVFHRMIRAFANRRRKASWYYMPLSELTHLLDDFASAEVHTTGVAAVFGFTEGQRRALATLDRALVRITPRPWRYVAYGVAVKGV